MSATIVKKTAYIYRKAKQRRLTPDRTVLSVLADAVCMCMYVHVYNIAYRELGLPRKLQDIAAASNNTPKEVAQDYRLKAISKRESLASSKLRKVE